METHIPVSTKGIKLDFLLKTAEFLSATTDQLHAVITNERGQGEVAKISWSGVPPLFDNVLTEGQPILETVDPDRT